MNSNRSEFTDWLAKQREENVELLLVLHGEHLHLHSRARVGSAESDKFVLRLPERTETTEFPPNAITISLPGDCSFQFSEQGDKNSPPFGFGESVPVDSFFFLKLRAGIFILIAAIKAN